MKPYKKPLPKWPSFGVKHNGQATIATSSKNATNQAHNILTSGSLGMMAWWYVSHVGSMAGISIYDIWLIFMVN